MAETMVRVSPNPRRPLSNEDAREIRAAKRELEDADLAYRAAVLKGLENGTSVREMHAFTGLATSTLQAWKKSLQ